jgi:hypothetical protein
MLGLWDADGVSLAELRLASLDLSPDSLSALVRTVNGPCVERLERVPGIHYVLLAPLANGTVLTVGVGPRSRSLPPDRIARFLRGDPGIEPPYTISLSAPAHTDAQFSDALQWRRDGWSARGERRIDLPGGVRHVHLRVDLRSPWALLVRGLLVVSFDVVLLGAIWLLGLVIAEGWRPRPALLMSAVRTSYRAQLTAVLSVFLVLPVLGFAAWSFARLTDESRRAGDLLIRQTPAMQPAAPSASPANAPRRSGIRWRTWRRLDARAVAVLLGRVDRNLVAGAGGIGTRRSVPDEPAFEATLADELR